jgi:hypothetical protein
MAQCVPSDATLKSARVPESGIELTRVITRMPISSRYAFDLIELNDDNLRRDPLKVRKATLASIVAQGQPRHSIQ